MELTLERLMFFLSYDKESGLFTWKQTCNNKRFVGKIAGCNNGGYCRIGIGKKYYFAHRLAWLFVYGKFPSYFLDHINGNGLDNRINNLRECSLLENAQNIKRNRSLPTGVSFDLFSSQWRAQIWSNGKYKSKRFKNIDDAISWRRKIKQEMHTFNPVDR